MEGESKASAAGKAERHFGIPPHRKQDKLLQCFASALFFFCCCLFHIPLAVLEQQAHTGTHVQLHHVMVSTVTAWGTCGLQGGVTKKTIPCVSYKNFFEMRLSYESFQDSSATVHA